MCGDASRPPRCLGGESPAHFHTPTIVLDNKQLGMLAGCPGRAQRGTYTEAGLCSEPLVTLPALALGTRPPLCPVPGPLRSPEHPVPPRSDFSFPSGSPPGTWAQVPHSAAPPLRPMDTCERQGISHTRPALSGPGGYPRPVGLVCFLSRGRYMRECLPRGLGPPRLLPRSQAVHKHVSQPDGQRVGAHVRPQAQPWGLW